MVMSSAYVVTWMSRGGVGRSDTPLMSTSHYQMTAIQ